MAGRYAPHGTSGPTYLSPAERRDGKVSEKTLNQSCCPDLKLDLAGVVEAGSDAAAPGSSRAGSSCSSDCGGHEAAAGGSGDGCSDGCDSSAAKSSSSG